MQSHRDSKTDVGMDIQRTLISINDVSLKIKKELEKIDELVRENGHLQTVVDTANEVLSKKIIEMGMSITNIIDNSERSDRLEPNLGSITSVTVTEKVLEQLNET